LDEFLDEVQVRVIDAALKRTSGDYKRAARLLNLKAPALRRRRSRLRLRLKP